MYGVKKSKRARRRGEIRSLGTNRQNADSRVRVRGRQVEGENLSQKGGRELRLPIADGGLWTWDSGLGGKLSRWLPP